jgi:uncharacterized membrane protein YccC
MAAPTATAPAPPGIPAKPATRPWWKPVWSVPAAMRAVRATIVIPSLFAITSKVVGDPQMALFATFGGFATLVVTTFSGSPMDKVRSHLGLAIAGSAALVIGTLVSGTTWLAAVITVPVVFAIFFAGVLGPTPAAASTAILFAYVLPVASAGGASTIGSRLEGWWLASAAATIAVLLLAPKSPGDRIRAAASALAAEIGRRVAAAANGEASDSADMRAAKDRMRAVFTAAPYRPTGLASADQALATLVQLLDWSAAQVADAFDGHIKMTEACPADRELLRLAAGVYADVATLLSPGGATPRTPRDMPDGMGRGPGEGSISGMPSGPDVIAALEELEQARAAATAHLRDLSAAEAADERVAAAHAVHAQAIAIAARSAAAEALIAIGRGAPAALDAERRKWYGVPAVTAAAEVVMRHASVRSVWFANSLRGAVALAIAVAVADLSSVQHGFWVVLGTLSVLRSNAAGTGATALRALAGTVAGFVVGAALLEGIGTGQTAMWVAFPLAILVAAYAPGTAPFTVGQGAFTIVIVVLFNLLVPVGWKVGLLRVEDVAIGCAVSAAVGVLFWPRGAAALVGDDLADAFRRGAGYLMQAVDWALSERTVPPDAVEAAVAAGVRLDDALRGFLAEQGTKRASKEDLWMLVSATQRLRLTASSLAGLRHMPPPGVVDGPACLPLEGADLYTGTPACAGLRTAALALAGFYGQVATELGHPGRDEPALLPPPPLTGPAVPRAAAGAEAPPDESHRPHPHLLWVQEHLHHLSQSAQMISEPTLHVAQARRRPWWR